MLTATQTKVTSFPVKEAIKNLCGTMIHNKCRHGIYQCRHTPTPTQASHDELIAIIKFMFKHIAEFDEMVVFSFEGSEARRIHACLTEILFELLNRLDQFQAWNESVPGFAIRHDGLIAFSPSGTNAYFMLTQIDANFQKVRICGFTPQEQIILEKEVLPQK